MTKVYATTAAALLAVMLGVIGWFVWTGRTGGEEFAQCRDSVVAGGAGALGGPFELVDHNGTTVTDADVLSRPSLIYFGYTFCPDVCPIDVDRNAIAVDILQERGYDVQPVFITVDPKRDTPEVLANFAANLHPNMVGLTGSPEQVRAAAQAYRVYYQSHESADDPYYLVDHTTFSYLVLPGHGFVEFFRRELAPDALAERTTCFLNAT